MPGESQHKKPNPLSEPLSIPNLAAPEITAEPFPLVVRLIRFIRQKRK